MDNQEQLSHYVSNLDKDIYTVYNLPEEVIATVFAYVSRSPKGFRENLLKVTEDKAKAFHEKWVLNYGHASVAELATVHIGIEKVSRLFSALLERSNLYFSPIEYSQRYQKPKKGDFHVPEELTGQIQEEYIHFQNEIYDHYIELFEKLKSYLSQTIKMEADESEKSYQSRIEKVAFEDARYVLTLSVYTNLGITSNARAMESALITLLSSEYSEVRNRAEEIKNEIFYSLPTLVKYAKENEFLKSIPKKLEKQLESNEVTPLKHNVQLINTNYKDENEALNQILTELYFQYSHSSFDIIKSNLINMPESEKIEKYQELFEYFSSHDNPPEVFEEIRYKFELVLSESCWHQLLRHRKVRFSWEYPTIDLGFVIPPNIKKANLESEYSKVINKINNFYLQLKAQDKLTAHYCVSNAHNRRIIAEFSLWELFHLMNLRMMPQAQWEIRDLMNDIVNQIKVIHPNLIQVSLDRIQKRQN